MMTASQADYKFEEHAHRFACWTAARAASTSRFSNKEVSAFFKSISLRSEVDDLTMQLDLTIGKYHSWFMGISDKLLNALSNAKRKQKNGKDLKRVISFGVAAKMISIYVKAYHVIPTKGQSLLSSVVYPPIDGILLKNVGVVGFPWSTLSQEEFEALLLRLTVLNKGVLNWRAEENWDVS